MPLLCQLCIYLIFFRKYGNKPKVMYYDEILSIIYFKYKHLRPIYGITKWVVYELNRF